MTDKGKKKKTREVIIDTALRMFNEEGESNVTTNAIADELDISPGTLHYHFKSKEELVSAIFQDFDTGLRVRTDPGQDIVQIFENASREFEFLWKYRFIFRDIAQLRFKYDGIKRAIGRMMHHQIDRVQSICEGMGVPNDRGQADSLARSLVVISNYWISFEAACGIEEEDDSDRLARLVFQVATLVEPYLSEEVRATIMHLFDDYISS